MAEAGPDIGRDQLGQIPAKCEGGGRMDVPRESLQHGVFHGHDVLGQEVSAAELNEGGHAELARFKELDGEVEGGHGGQLENATVHRACGKIPVKIGHGHVDHLPVEVEMVHNLVAPLTDFFTPQLVDLGGGRFPGGPLVGVGQLVHLTCNVIFRGLFHQARLPFGRQVVRSAVVGGLLTSHDLEALADLDILRLADWVGPQCHGVAFRPMRCGGLGQNKLCNLGER